MPRREAKAYLEDVVEACDAVARYVVGMEYEGYLQDDRTRNAVERCLFVMGEAVNQLRHMEPLEVHTLGDVQGIIDVRNILAHSYFAVKHDLAWDMVVDDVPRLRAAARRWLDLFG